MPATAPRTSPRFAADCPTRPILDQGWSASSPATTGTCSTDCASTDAARTNAWPRLEQTQVQMVTVPPEQDLDHRLQVAESTTLVGA